MIRSHQNSRRIASVGIGITTSVAIVTSEKTPIASLASNPKTARNAVWMVRKWANLCCFSVS